MEGSVEEQKAFSVTLQGCAAAGTEGPGQAGADSHSRDTWLTADMDLVCLGEEMKDWKLCCSLITWVEI